MAIAPRPPKGGQDVFEISIPCDAGATYDTNDVCMLSQRHTHVHHSDADVGGATQLEGNEKIAASDSPDVKNHHSNKTH